MGDTLIRQDNTYRLNNLPKLKSNAFIWNGSVGYTGSLIKRPVKGTLGAYKHFGFIYGFDDHDTLWVIENNINGVECITYRDFLQGSLFNPIINHNTNQDLSFGIMLRAFEKGFDQYHSRDNNCEHFVNYCLYGVHKSMQTDFTETMLGTVISVIEMSIYLDPKIKDNVFLDNLNKIREKMRLNRPETMQKLFESNRL